jgi:hypothetical protein
MPHKRARPLARLTQHTGLGRAGKLLCGATWFSSQLQGVRWIAGISVSPLVHPRYHRVCWQCKWNGCGRRLRRNPKAPGNNRKACKGRQARGRPCQGRLKAMRRVSAKCYGPAALTAYRKARLPEYFAPQVPSLLRFQPGKGRNPVVATRRKTRAAAGSRRRFVGDHGAWRLIQRPKGLATPTERPERA